MKYEIVFAPEAVKDVQRLKAYDRSRVRDVIEESLRHTPMHVSKSRIKRLEGTSWPQFRLRVADVRVFYDVRESTVEILAVVPTSQAAEWLRKEGGVRMKRVALSDVKDGLSKYLHVAEHEDVVITRHGKPAGILVGFKSDDDWFDYRLEHDPRFLRRIASARENLRKGRGVRFEDVQWE